MPRHYNPKQLFTANRKKLRAVLPGDAFRALRASFGGPVPGPGPVILPPVEQPKPPAPPKPSPPRTGGPPGQSTVGIGQGYLSPFGEALPQAWRWIPNALGGFTAGGSPTFSNPDALQALRQARFFRNPEFFSQPGWEALSGLNLGDNTWLTAFLRNALGNRWISDQGMETLFRLLQPWRGRIGAPSWWPKLFPAPPPPAPPPAPPPPRPVIGG